MPLLGAIAKAIGTALSKSTGSSSSSGGSSKSSSGGSTGKTSVGGYSNKYEYDKSGNIYKDGRLISQSDYKYIPSDVLSKAQSGGSTSSSGTKTSVPGFSYNYEYDNSGNIYKDGRLVSKDNYSYLPSQVTSAASKSTQQPNYLSGIGGVIGRVGEAFMDSLARSSEAGAVAPVQEMPPVQYVTPEVPYASELASIIGELQDMGSQSYDSGSAALINQAYNDTLAQIDAAQAELMKQMNDQMSGVDPATMASLKVIRDSVEQNRQNLMEEMNRRGLLQSGIWLEQENKLNSAQANAEQNLLATRLQDLQTQLNQALSNFGAMRVDAASNKSVQGLQALENEAARKQNAIQSGLQAALNLYNYNQQYASDMMPYYMQTVDQKRNTNLAYDEAFGEAGDWNNTGSGVANNVGSGSPSSDLVSVREYASTFPGATVEWDKNTQSVIVNGQRIEAPDIQGGRAYVSKSTLDRILGGR